MTPDERAQFLDERTVLLAEVGSTAHGVTHSSNDLDQIAVYVPPAEEMLGLSRPEHYIYRPGRGPHDPSGPGDLDRTYYSLRKFVGLLDKGNPSILYALYGPQRVSTNLGQRLCRLGPQFATAKTRNAYLGYAKAQRERIQGTRGAAGRIRRSPEGGGEIDWKYAMHMVRLGIQGVEYLVTGRISSPSLERDYLLAVRSGEVPLADVIAKAIDNEDRLYKLGLPTHNTIDWTSWLADNHLLYWGYSTPSR